MSAKPYLFGLFLLAGVLGELRNRTHTSTTDR